MSSRFNGWSLRVLDVDNAEEVAQYVDQYGFAIVSGDWRYDASDFHRMAVLYALGPMHQSEFNRREHSEGVSSSGMNQVGGLSSGHHFVFNNTSGVPLHTDGSYLPIGTIKTSIILCKEPALSGGESILFDSVSAFRVLSRDYPDLAECLLAANVFRRRSTGRGSGRQYEHIGPVFSRAENGDIVGGFTLDVTADWDYSRRIDPRTADAVAYLTRLASEESGYLLTFALRKGQAMIIRNDELSHGRYAYVDDPARPRILLRGLFEVPLRGPSIANRACTTSGRP
ncbi:TauD/TfdA family dioxygenase [Streptomyces sp. NPDC006476]|uniref:TauD/TfdA family dioxygenase n=1 Tax=Streptomyces sp. NPDC006476 TaxID=3157175 RepID=UPI0033ADE195